MTDREGQRRRKSERREGIMDGDRVGWRKEKAEIPRTCASSYSITIPLYL